MWIAHLVRLDQPLDCSVLEEPIREWHGSVFRFDAHEVVDDLRLFLHIQISLLTPCLRILGDHRQKVCGFAPTPV
jgi:hypothetical protein